MATLHRRMKLTDLDASVILDGRVDYRRGASDTRRPGVFPRVVPRRGKIIDATLRETDLELRTLDNLMATSAAIG